MVGVIGLRRLLKPSAAALTVYPFRLPVVDIQLQILPLFHSLSPPMLGALEDSYIACWVIRLGRNTDQLPPTCALLIQSNLKRLGIVVQSLNPDIEGPILPLLQGCLLLLGTLEDRSEPIDVELWLLDCAKCERAPVLRSDAHQLPSFGASLVQVILYLEVIISKEHNSVLPLLHQSPLSLVLGALEEESVGSALPFPLVLRRR
jgi:hypothetical protein